MKLWRPFKNDKANHAAYGAGLYILLRLTSVVLLNNWVPDYLCLAAVVCAGLLLEIYQPLSNTGKPEALDFFAVMAPALFLYVVEINFIHL